MWDDILGRQKLRIGWFPISDFMVSEIINNKKAHPVFNDCFPIRHIEDKSVSTYFILAEWDVFPLIEKQYNDLDYPFYNIIMYDDGMGTQVVTRVEDMGVFRGIVK